MPSFFHITKSRVMKQPVNYSEMVRNKTHQICHFHGVSPIHQTIITTHGKISEFLFGFSSSRKGK